jgi:hypothetical protein
MKIYFPLMLAFMHLSCSNDNGLKSSLEKQIPANASSKVRSVCDRYIEDCLVMYSRFNGVKKTTDDYDKATRDFRKDFPDNYMLKTGVEICRENNITDSAEIKTIETFSRNMMTDYFAYMQQ